MYDNDARGRRAMLATMGAVVAGGLAGCFDADDHEATEGTPTDIGEPPSEETETDNETDEDPVVDETETETGTSEE